MNLPPEYDDDRYLEAMAPSVATLTALADAIRGLGPSNMPHVGSQGFAEVLADGRLEGDAKGHLSASSHSLAGLTLMAASDHARAFARLHSQAPAPAFAHIALTRAALEALVWARWLGEPGPGVTPEVRRRRGIAARLYSAIEEAKVEQRRTEANELAMRLRCVAAATGAAVRGSHRGDLTVGGEKLPSIKDEFNRLLVVSVDRFGPTLWSYLCGVAHGTLYGILSGINDSSPDPLDPNTTMATIGSDSRSVNTLVLVLLRGLRTVTAERLSLMGWTSGSWDDANEIADELERRLVKDMYGLDLPRR